VYHEIERRIIKYWKTIEIKEKKLEKVRIQELD